MGIFGDHALILLKCGLAVLPCADKAPLVGGFNRWCRPPSELTIAKWRSNFPDANIAYHAGLSGLVVVDADSTADVDRCRSIFGATPGRVRTRRGEHALYRAPAAVMSRSINLRAFGLNADLKYGRGGQSIVVAPPSLHPAGGTYQWIDCDPADLGDLPVFDVSCLQNLLVRPSVRPAPRMRDGSRKQWLNDRLCAHVGSCDSLDGLLDVATTLNDELEEHGYHALEDIVVVQRAQNVWADYLSGKLEGRPYTEATAKFSRTELKSS